jgi:hypothetical protein
MALVRNNIVTEGISGMLAGKLVFRSYQNKTVVSARPRKPTKESKQQRENRNKFKEAATWAKEQMKFLEVKSAYQIKAKELGLPNAYTAAVTEYMRKPVIEDVKVEEDMLTVKAFKEGFEIREVEVVVLDEDGKEITSGKLTKAVNRWIMHCPILLQKGFVVSVKVLDKVGNRIMMTKQY